MFRVTINGEEHVCVPGQTVLALLRSLDVHVPALCDDPRLAPSGGCRLCLVEIRGQSRPATACTTMLADGMEIATHTEQLEHLRRTQLRLLARHYPREAPTGHPSNEFRRWIHFYKLADEFDTARRPELIDETHPCIHVDMSRCIHCFRCVRMCEEVAGCFVWRAWNRGDRTEVRPAQRVAFGDSDCVSCGACVDTCPSGALCDKFAIAGADPAAEVRTVCPYCGTGCEMHVGHREGRLCSVRPVVETPVNKGHLCVKGRYGWDFVHASDRVTRPMARHGEAWEPIGWPEAIERVAQGLRQTLEKYGPGAVGILGSSRATNEENYLTQKFARLVLGTNNVDCCARVCHAPTAAGMRQMLGAGAATNSFDDIEQARSILLCGVNPTDNHPVVGDRIRQAALRGAELIVIDPRQITLTEYARVHLQIRPGTNIPLLNAMAHTILDEGLAEPAAGAIDEWASYQASIARYSPELAAQVCGVSAEKIREAARLYATSKPSMCFHGLGVTEHVQGTEGVICLVNLAVLTGNIGRPGAGINPLRGQNNVQGAAHMGCDPGLLTGSAPLAEHRQQFEAVWRASLSAQPGLNLMQMIDAALQGQLKSLWVIGYDIALSNPNMATTLQALRGLELVVIQDLFLTETARAAGSIFLPACSSFEKNGTFMNSERRIQRVRQVIEPVGESRTDWEILCDVARAMGHGDQFAFQSVKDIWNEIRSVWPAGAGISYRRLEAGGLQWPCPTEGHPGTTVLHTDLVADPHRVHLQPVDYRPTGEQPTAEFPFLLNTGRALYQFNAATMSGRSRTAVFQPHDELQIAASDAQRLGIAPGQMVRIRSRYGSTQIPARISNAVRPSELFATFQSPDIALNRVTSPHRDRHVQTPEYKVTAVSIEAIAGNHLAGEALEMSKAQPAKRES